MFYFAIEGTGVGMWDTFSAHDLFRSFFNLAHRRHAAAGGAEIGFCEHAGAGSVQYMGRS